MSANQAAFPIALMARVLGVSKAGYDAWRHRPASAHALADVALLKRIRTVHATSRDVARQSGDLPQFWCSQVEHGVTKGHIGRASMKV